MSACVLLAAFDTPERAAAAVEPLRRAGHTVREAYAPMPSEELTQAIGHRENWIRPIMFVAALAGITGGLGMTFWSSVFDYPINSGGRPLASWPAFVPIAFEIGILSAALIGFVAFLFRARLTQLHAPIFSFDGFERASRDRSFLEIETPRPSGALLLLEHYGATAVTEREA